MRVLSRVALTAAAAALLVAGSTCQLPAPIGGSPGGARPVPVASGTSATGPDTHAVPPTPTASPASAPAAYYQTRVYYGTDRALAGDRDPYAMFGAERGELSLGACNVAIPLDHEAGALESHAWWKLRFHDDPRKDVTILDAVPMAEGAFVAELQARVAASSRHSALIFIHGFNVTFADAVRRTAQMSFDLGFDGAALTYSWPSRGEVRPYTVDETNADWTGPHLRRFLTLIATRTGVTEASLIVHSMGNRAFASALNDLVANPSLGGMKLNEIVLAAPDIDKETFRQQVAPKLARTEARITLYASNHDEALLASKTVHAYPRAGDAHDGIVVADGVESIDVSAAEHSLLGHSYFGDRVSVLADIHGILVDHKKPRDRFGIRGVPNDTPAYWRFVPQP